MTELVKLPAQPIRCKNLIGGEWRDATGNKTIEVVSPYTGKAVGSVPMSTPEDVSAAVAAAADAAPGWRMTPLKERTQTLFRFRELLFANIDRLANIAAVEAGKTVAEAKAGVLKGIEVVEYALSLQNLDAGGALEVSRGVTCEVRREPLGVVAGVTPFNFPAMVPMWMFPSALTLGNCFILKPSEKVPLSSMIIAELIEEAGYPPGVFSVVHGGRETVEALTDHPGIAAVGFVGSTPAAKSVYARATSHGKRALALGGAKNHLIVVPDADPNVTTDGVVQSFIGCAGQRCMAASLLVAVGQVDSLLDAIVEKTKTVALGTEMGAIIEKASFDRITAAIAKAEKDGATLRVDGRKAKAPAGYEGGYWMGPTVIDNATPDMECATSELFGPVITIVRVNTLDEAIALGEKSNYGNATSVFTTHGGVAQKVVQAATTGMVGVNIGVPVPREPFSFGGTKDSRFGAGDITGSGGVELWSSLKKVTTKWAIESDHNWMS